MSVKLQLVLGVLLVFSTCSGTIGGAKSRQIRQVVFDNNTTSTTEHVTLPTTDNAPTEKTDRQANLIDNLPKTETELKDVNTQNNLTSIKLTKSEPYARIPDLIEEEDHTQQAEFKSIAEKEQDEENKENVIKQDSNEKKDDENKENVIKQDSSEKNREDNSRSIDVDIKQLVLPEFRGKNNVFSAPISSDTEKYYDTIFEHKSATSRLVDFSKLELTTPKAEFFDSKFKEAVQSIDDKLEQHIGIEDNDEEDEDMSEADSKDIQVDKLIDEYKTTPHSNLNYKEMKNMIHHNNGDKNLTHKGMTIEHVKHINFETSFNDTMTYNEENPEEKQSKGDADHLDTTTPKNNFIITTRKAIAVTKPAVNRNNSYILSNNIETDTLKAINIVTTQLPVRKIKGDVEQSTASHDATAQIGYKREPTIEENVIAATTPIKSERITTAVPTATQTEEYLMPTVTVYKTEEITTVTEELTTNLDTTQATTTEDITEDISTSITLVQKTEFVTEEATTPIEQDSTTAEWFKVKDEPSTTLREQTSTMVEELKLFEPTSDVASTQETTLQADEARFTTTFANDDKTEPQTTEAGFRTSKLLVYADFTTTTESITEKTTEALTEKSTQSFMETTTQAFTTSSSTQTTTFENTTPELVAIDTTTIESTTTTEFATNAPTTTTTAHSNHQHIDEYPNETVEDRIHISTTVPPTSTVDFIHIENVNGNQTTLLPETLSPIFNYPNPETEKPFENRQAGDESMTINTSTDDGPEGADTPSTENSVIEPPPGDRRGTIAAIVISSVGAICLVLLAGLLYIMRKRQKRFNYGQRCRPVSLDDYSMDNVSVYNSVRRKGVLRQSKRSYGNPAFDDPVAVTHPLNFPALAKFANNADDIKAEFEEIPQIAARTSELPEGCETKNRYANVIPLPETRVFLKPIDGYPNSDYINANYVTGPKNTKGYYIACQAPLQSTVDDFWRMVWEQQSKVILMITHLFENGVEKCVDYLPPSEVLDCHRLFGDFQVTLKKREVKDKYIISSLQLKNMVSNSWREVTHFWYMGWPEKGVPSEGNSLIAFLIEARSFMKTSTLDKNAAANGNMPNGSAVNEVNPVVIHCSPGTGRTGVVIACDIAIREFEQTRLVDIPKIVYRIRRDRASAVQTKEQYMFIYKVVSLYATKLTGGALDSF